MNKSLWFEVWADEGLSPPYLLILLCIENEADLLICDPAKNTVVYRASTYEIAKNWLLEDEYSLVKGRMSEERTGAGSGQEFRVTRE